jgi:hypothetical protein
MSSKTTEKPETRRLHEEKKREATHHDKAMEDTFPASDPPSTTQPGSGFTGSEVIDDRKKPKK